MKQAVIFIAAILLLFACSRSPILHRIENLGDTPYQEDTIRFTYAHNPGRALALLDSAIILGNIDPYHALLTRATIYSRSQEEQRLDEAQVICESLLQHDSVASFPDRRSAVLDLLVYTSRMKYDDVAYIKWATQQAELCRQTGDEVEGLRTEAEICVAMARLGQVEEAIEKLDRIIHELDRPGSINRMDALSIAVKRKINVLNEEGKYELVAPLPKIVLARLDHYESHSEDYAEDSFRLSWSEHPKDRDRYLDFTRGQAYAFLVNSYATFKKDSALYYLNCLKDTDYGKGSGAREMIIPAQMALGMYKEAMATYDRVEQRMGADTLNAGYAVLLRDRGTAAHAMGKPEEAYQYMCRYARLTRNLSDELMKGKAHEYAARYQAMEKELAIQEARNKSHIRGRVLLISLFLLAICFITQVLLFRQKRIVEAKNRALVQQIGEAINYKEKYEEAIPEIPTKDMDHEQLFNHLKHIIRRDALYLDPAFDRQKVAQLFQLSNHQVGAAFSQGSEFDSIAGFIRDCRLEYSCVLLTEHPELSIKEVAFKSGFQYASTYSTDFRNRYALTPTEYRKLQEGK